KSNARGVVAGLTRFVTAGHIARAALEATAFQSREVVEAMNSDSGVALESLKVDGGMVGNDLLMQFQADLLGVPVIRPKVPETTSLGAAYAAGLATGFWGEVEDLRENWVEDNGGCYIVPAFSGLFAPYWKSNARGVIAGLTRYVNAGHIARATLEATAYQSREVVEAMDADSGVALESLKVDGGMVGNDLLMQFQADLLGVPVIRPKVPETTSLGAAYAAGLATGLWNEVEDLRENWVEDNGGCYIVPAFSGLFAPYWKSNARGVVAGLTRYVNAGHIARATLEATAYQSREVVEAMDADSGVALESLKVDGGMVGNDLLMQFQADLLGVPVIRPKVPETTSLGAAYAAGLATGFWNEVEDLRENWVEDKRWEPTMDSAKRDEYYGYWKKAVTRTFDWFDADDD
ncbi:MAG: hypothetical protein H0T69_12310, partial [Thermoleophilaceae bacterium]|nr:hypothetical protein [Thermoleophilaceae bacterium]